MITVGQRYGQICVSSFIKVCKSDGVVQEHYPSPWTFNHILRIAHLFTSFIPNWTCSKVAQLSIPSPRSSELTVYPGEMLEEAALLTLMSGSSDLSSATRTVTILLQRTHDMQVGFTVHLL